MNTKRMRWGWISAVSLGVWIGLYTGQRLEDGPDTGALREAKGVYDARPHLSREPVERLRHAGDEVLLRGEDVGTGEEEVSVHRRK